MAVIKRLEKSKFSEWVIRQALYWLTPTARWTLDETRDSWVVSVTDDSFELRAELDRLLNDYLLREQLMIKTQPTRQAIATAVLENIQKKVSE